MTLDPLPGFHSLATHHCVTGSLRHIYVFNGHPLNEEMLLGLGAGVGFVYWHQKGELPFIGGRGNARGEFEPLVGARTGVAIQAYTSASARRAEQAVLDALVAGQPVMIQCDMGYLPYFDFGAEFHFGGHVIVVCGYDAATRQVLVADRDEPLHAVSLDDLEKARGSTHKPFAPQRRWYQCDFSAKREPAADEIRTAIGEMATAMLEPPIANLGVKGIRTAGQRIAKWPQAMDEGALRGALFNVWIYTDATGGTGGGLFRYMLGRFLSEAAERTGIAGLDGPAEAFRRIGDGWQQVAVACQAASAAANPSAALPTISEQLCALADQERAAWQQARQWI